MTFLSKILFPPRQDMNAEGAFLPPEDANPVKELAAAVGEAEDTQTDSQVSQKFQNPWPHLENYFVLKSRDMTNANVLHFRCIMCHPKETIINGQTGSLYNLKSHVKRKHPAHVTQFEERIKAGSIRGKSRQSPLDSDSSTISQSSHPPAKKRCQSTIGEAFGQSAAGTSVRQSVVDTKIVDLFVCNMLPLHVVESPTFVSLIRTLNSSKTSMSCHTLGRRILASHKQLEAYLIRLLRDIPWVATTADCWSAHNRSYLGMTAHWVQPKTRMRQHAVLTCSRLIGHHAFDVLAETMVDTHYKFHLQDKVTRTTTDNGRNFVKAFVQFGTEIELLPDVCFNPDMEGVEDVGLDVDHEDEDVGEVEYIPVDAALDESNGLGLRLPVHMRCSAHTLNLVASVDANKALDSISFKLAYRKAMSKAQALWNQQRYSIVAADSILSELERRLVVPNSTRWNSTYDSVVVLNNLLGKKRRAVHRVMMQLKLQPFTDSDVGFLTEYVQVMSIIAKALDKIQGEDQAYLGSLLPTVVATIIKLKEAKSKHLLYCSPLVDALLAGITKRFGLLLEDQECQLAAAFHPKFRLFWLEQHDNSQLSRAKKAMETAVESALKESSEEGSSTTSNNEDMEADFFSTITKSQDQEIRSHKSLKSKAQNLVKTWLEASSKEGLADVAFIGEQVLIDLFTKYNTPIPSSAAVEHFFSIEKDILRAKRASLSDGNFEKLMFMKGNQHHMKEMEKTQPECVGEQSCIMCHHSGDILSVIRLSFFTAIYLFT